MNKLDDKKKNGENETDVSVSFPNEISVELVQANELRHYEIFQWLVAIFLPIAAGFWTGYFTIENNSALLWSAVIFTVVSFLFIRFAYTYRKKVFHGSIKKTVKLSDFKN